jgi:hypothetical protein
MTCTLCGENFPITTMHWEYHPHLPRRPFCDDRGACWARWDRGHPVAARTLPDNVTIVQ